MQKFKHIRKIKISELSTSFFSILAVVLYPCLFPYFNNIDKAHFTEVSGITTLFLLHAVLVFLLFLILFRNLSMAGLLTNISMLFILLFGIIEKVIIRFLAMLYYWHIVMVVLTAIIGLTIIVKRFQDQETISNINSVLIVIFVGLILFNAITAAPVLYKKIVETTEKSTNEVQKGTQEAEANVYYFIFDEYSGPENLQRYCNYDNTPFYDALEELGFNVSKNSHNYTLSSDVEIPNLLNLDLVVTGDMTHETRVKALNDAFIFRLFKENGYMLNVMLDAEDYIPIIVTNADYQFVPNTRSAEEDSVEALIIKNSIYYPLQTKQTNVRITEINSMFQYVSNSWKLQPEYLFTFGYFKFPHMPWVVNKYGESISLSDKTNWRNSDVYLGQLQYGSKLILGAMQEIITNDPDAIIIIQSDHGYRQKGHLYLLYGEPIDDMTLENYYQSNILNAVYYKGELLDIESLSGINTLRQILAKHFGLELEYIESANKYETLTK